MEKPTVDPELLPGKVIMQAVCGSRAYGLDTPESDYDLKGVYVSPTIDVASLKPPTQTVDHTDPDWAFHEVGKFISLCLKCNPTTIEQLYLAEYDFVSSEFQMLIDRRDLFLSSRAIFGAYGRYAEAQMKRLLNREDSSFGHGRKYSKHARHSFRLLQQGMELITTGTMGVRVSNPEELFAVGELPPDELVAKFDPAIAAFDAACDNSLLPAHPDRDLANHLLRQIRWENVWV